MCSSPSLYSIVVFGEGGVGKSALTVQYVSHIFLDFHDPTIEDVYQTQRTIDGEACTLNILDTAGQDELQTALNDQYLHQGEGYIAVYSITDHRSFQRLISNVETLKEMNNSERIPLVLVGNKTDLFAEREVSTTEGLALARELGCPFYEASAANTINVDDIFNGVVRKIRQRRKEHIPSSLNFRLVKPKIKYLRRFISRKVENALLRVHSFAH